jgi:anti-sigma factor RsiW
VNHPSQGEWVAFLYGEVPSKTKRDLQAHLDACPACSAQVESWRSSMSALDTWRLPARRSAPTANVLVPIFKWAAAAAAVLVVGFLLGRHSSSTASEIAELKSSVAQLTDLVQSQSAVTLTNSIAASTTIANAETVRLLAEYSRAQQDQRTTDRQSVKLALGTLNDRLNRIYDDLETVAFNTESGFQETHENITRVASLSLAKD